LFRYGKIEQEVKDKASKEIRVKHGEILFSRVSFKYHDRYIFAELLLSEAW
jgi:hypothetical protein